MMSKSEGDRILRAIEYARADREREKEREIAREAMGRELRSALGVETDEDQARHIYSLDDDDNDKQEREDR